jgi:hypothetical protein
VTGFAAQVLSVGAGELGAASLKTLAVIAVALVPLAALGWLLGLYGRPKRTVPLQPLPPAGGEVIDDMLPAVFEHRPQPAPWPDGDTVIADRTGLNERLKGDGRDG